MNESPDIMAVLRARVSAIEGPKPTGAALFALGGAMLDAQLGGGLPKGRLHELFAGEEDDRAAMAGAALMLALQAAGGRAGAGRTGFRSGAADRGGGAR